VGLAAISGGRGQLQFFIPSLAMQIIQDTAVTLQYQVTTPAGKPLDSGHLAYLHGGYDSIFPKVEAALDGQAAGFAVTLNLSAADAFGERDESLVRVIPKAEFPPGVKVGGQLQGAGLDGQPQVFNVVKIKGPEVHLDGNHELAGQALQFRCTVMAVRPATTEEITHRHVHGEHGHQH
jgi:FKBP-type peptidyl-prolyl cis-trans isomerase SlyD